MPAVLDHLERLRRCPERELLAGLRAAVGDRGLEVDDGQVGLGERCRATAEAEAQG